MIYNATIDSELQTLDQLLEKSPLLADFKAVKTGNVVYGEEPVPVHNGTGRADPRLPYRYCRRRSVHPEILTQSVLKGEDFP